MNNLKPISVVVRNERGVLARVASLFARRGFNITSLAVGETEDPRFSRISVVVDGDDATVEQAVKQLNRLVCVMHTADLSHAPRVERGLAMIKIKADPAVRAEVMNLVTIFRARVDHVGHDVMVIEVSGDRGKVQAAIEMLRPYGIIEMARTGQIALSRASSINGTHTSQTCQPAEADGEPAIFNRYQALKEA